MPQRYLLHDIQAGQLTVFVSVRRWFQRFHLANIYLALAGNNEVDATLSYRRSDETVEGARPRRRFINKHRPWFHLAEKPGADGRRDIGGRFFSNTKSNRRPPSARIRRRSARPAVAQRTENVPLLNKSRSLRARWLKNPSGQCSMRIIHFLRPKSPPFGRQGVLETIHSAKRRLLFNAGDAAVHGSTLTNRADTVHPYSLATGTICFTKKDHKPTMHDFASADADHDSCAWKYPASNEVGNSLSGLPSLSSLP